jgi:hypothetical protein
MYTATLLPHLGGVRREYLGLCSGQTTSPPQAPGVMGLGQPSHPFRVGGEQESVAGLAGSDRDPDGHNASCRCPK